MIGLNPKSIYWWENDWWNQPGYAQYTARLKSINTVKPLFNERWCKSYVREIIAEADERINTLKGCSHPNLKSIMNGYDCSSDLKKYLIAVQMLGVEQHPLFKELRAEGTYVLEMLCQLGEALQVMKSHRNFIELSKRLRRRAEFDATLLEIHFAKTLKQNGIKFRVKGKSRNPSRNYDYVCSFEGESLGVDVTRIGRIERRISLANAVHILWEELVFSGGLGLTSFILWVANPEASKNVKTIIEEVKDIGSRVFEGELPDDGRIKVGNCGTLEYDQRNMNKVNVKTVSQIYDNGIEIKKIVERLKKKEKEGQFPKGRDYILTIFMPPSFIHTTDIHFPYFETLAAKRLIGILVISLRYIVGRPWGNEVTLIKNPNYSGRNLVMDAVMSGLEKENRG